MRPEDKLLPLLRGVVDDGPDKWKSLCPAHDDHDPSLHITKAEDGKLLLHCFVCNASAANICLAVGLTQSELYPESLDRLHRRQTKAGAKRPRNAKRAAEYLYQDEQGAVKFRAVRYEWPVEGKDKPEKDFEQHQPDGQGGWIFNLKGVERVLFRLPELLAADPAAVVYLVEGEKKVDLLRSLGFVATCNVGGSKGKWLSSYTKALAGRNVVILPDNDPINPGTGERPGHDWAVRILKNISGTAASVRIVELPGLPAKGDIVDWIAAGHTAKELLDLVGAATPEETAKVAAAAEQNKSAAPGRDPTSTHYEEQILKDLQLDVLGEIDGANGNIKVFSEAMRKSHIIREAGKLTYERLLQVCGPIVKAKINQGTEDIEGTHRMKDVRAAISMMSGFRRIDDETEVGVGCWTGMSDDMRDIDAIILVGAGEAAKWNGTKVLERVRKPRIGGRLLDIGSSEHWYDFDKLSDLMQKAGDSLWAYNVAVECETLFAKWRWKSDKTPMLISGLIIATWIQTIWAWRPLVAVIGRSNAGKTTLIEALAGIFGQLAIKSSRSSAAGIRQCVQRSAAVIMIDEFEASKARDEVLEMLRASSRGDKVLKGTAGHKGKEFVLRHIAWVAAIESGLKREPDQNRFITLECLPPEERMAGKLILPPSHELEELGLRLLAVAVRYGIEARELAVKMKSMRFTGVHARVIESFAVPAAVHASIRGIPLSDDSSIRQIMSDLLQSVDSNDVSEGDEEALVNDILSSVMRMDHGTEMTVSQGLQVYFKNEVDETLQRHGMDVIQCTTKEHATKIINGHELKGDHLFIGHKIVSRQLLKNTQWYSQSIDQILTRIPGSIRCQRRIAGMMCRGILVPMNSIPAISQPEEKQLVHGT